MFFFLKKLCNYNSQHQFGSAVAHDTCRYYIFVYIWCWVQRHVEEPIHFKNSHCQRIVCLVARYCHSSEQLYRNWNTEGEICLTLCSKAVLLKWDNWVPGVWMNCVQCSSQFTNHPTIFSQLPLPRQNFKHCLCCTRLVSGIDFAYC